ncbi:fructosamine kinase family protein [Chitinophaga nivalis]|uniref:Fructosamine kinase family protein n=1 Tax=Chitinophaga nivalis TaxID=2991709 RepID=A0ABT3IQ94_9BACT|nr:fructosamine kinase family protein [Chitinophaga nivalis]MCW3464258.1 fructosamine kinase family protein [Chitinophaga nivalis]MCW3486051.1 fructosamine kinase family protein [Chitinophaga nivalis]
MMDENLQIQLSAALSEQLKVKIHINEAKSVHGGDINETFRIATNEGYYFVKLNDAKRYPEMFTQEYAGLNMLRSVKALTLPQPLALGQAGSYSFLVMQFMTKGATIPDFWEDFGISLSRQHRVTQKNFGYPGPNYLGTLKQYNTPYNSWPVFYAFNRLLPLIRMAYDQQLADKQLVQQVERLCRQLPQLFPAEPPALLHGDLWSGNFMVGPNGKACVFDPAVYYGHREMDLAMTRLFGGFDNRFYQAYQQAWPLATGWQQRIGICQLYPLLVHMLLFGGHYYNDIRDVLQAF